MKKMIKGKIRNYPKSDNSVKQGCPCISSLLLIPLKGSQILSRIDRIEHVPHNSCRIDQYQKQLGLELALACSGHD